MSKTLPILFIHGFTSNINCVEKPVEKLRQAGFTVYAPILSGHGTNYKDMVGIGTTQWKKDVENALFDIYEKHQTPVGVAGFSLGGLLAIHLGITYPEMLDSLLLAAPALIIKDPLAPYSHIMGKFIKYWWSPNAFNDSTLKKQLNRSYPKFPVKSFVSLYNFANEIKSSISKLETPFHVIHSLKDQVVSPESARILSGKASSEQREISYLTKSGHELFLDNQSEEASNIALNYFLSRES